MSTRTEWMSAHAVGVEFTEHTDAYGTGSDGPALILSGDSAVAIEGTEDDMFDLARRIIAAVEATKAARRRDAAAAAALATALMDEGVPEAEVVRSGSRVSVRHARGVIIAEVEDVPGGARIDLTAYDDNTEGSVEDDAHAVDITTAVELIGMWRVIDMWRAESERDD